MNKTIFLSTISCLLALALSACTVAKLEARLEANPQCKDVVNPKTGAVMPCPGTDRAFYVAAGLEEPRKPKSAPVASSAIETTTPTGASNQVGSTPASKASPTATPTVQTDCKPKLHQKTGGMMPCPPLD
ncbi:hypothetical protein [Polynucleobacter sp. MWH-Svant-W18]|jgi:hypothetical protein|uniref:hypothetical protein n=1 Tax=Polynucleobacter sp. MWH-Svant-W18 TaxID=1855909 RepID=UPI001BFDD54D|nr:hypothetical protein [Polynucleobacter sp. MWH-Svant-W18]QWD77228.1 hypothetical protein C2757_04780 [Polynucleobacter sp. MWH-Svant-W18]